MLLLSSNIYLFKSIRILREKWPLLAKTNLCKSTRACFNVKKKKMLFLHELYRRIYSDAKGVEQHETKSE